MKDVSGWRPPGASRRGTLEHTPRLRVFFRRRCVHGLLCGGRLMNVFFSTSRPLSSCSYETTVSLVLHVRGLVPVRTSTRAMHAIQEYRTIALEHDLPVEPGKTSRLHLLSTARPSGVRTPWQVGLSRGIIEATSARQRELIEC